MILAQLSRRTSNGLCPCCRCIGYVEPQIRGKTPRARRGFPLRLWFDRNPIQCDRLSTHTGYRRPRTRRPAAARWCNPPALRRRNRGRSFCRHAAPLPARHVSCGWQLLHRRPLPVPTIGFRLPHGLRRQPRPRNRLIQSQRRSDYRDRPLRQSHQLDEHYRQRGQHRSRRLCARALHGIALRHRLQPREPVRARRCLRPRIPACRHLFRHRPGPTDPHRIHRPGHAHQYPRQHPRYLRQLCRRLFRRRLSLRHVVRVDQLVCRRHGIRSACRGRKPVAQRILSLPSTLAKLAVPAL